MSLKLTTSLSQRLVLTPQLRQRIEMLQMTTLELTDLIQQQLLENPVLEEVATQEEAQELAEKILDHLASSDSETNYDRTASESGDMEAGTPATHGSGDSDVLSGLSSAAEMESGESLASGEFNEDGVGEEHAG